MSFLSKLLRSASQACGAGANTLPYMHLQKYFQLFVSGVHTIKSNPPKDTLPIKIPGQLLRYLRVQEGEDFFDSESSFTTTGEFNNGKGGHIYHGEYITHGKDGGAMEYIYIVIASSEATADPTQEKFTPHFIYLGGLMSGETQQGVYSVFVFTQSDYVDLKARFKGIDAQSFTAVISALAYADVPFKKILAGEPVDADAIAADFSTTTPQMHVDTFYDTVDTRTHASLKFEMVK